MPPLNSTPLENGDSQEFLQGRNDLILDKLSNLEKDSKCVFSIHRTPTIKDYMQDRVELHLHFLTWVCRDSSIADYYCLRFEKNPVDWGNIADKSIVKGLIGKEHGSSITHCSDQQCSMLVNIGEFVQRPKGMGFEIIPSRIRLQPLND